MDRKPTLYVGLCAAIMGASLGFMFPAISPLRVFWYYPLLHRWVFELRPTGLAMDWYGRSLFTFYAGAVAFAVTYLVARPFKAISQRALLLCTAWAVTATLLAMGVYTFQLIVREPTPEPLPSWYVPK